MTEQSLIEANKAADAMAGSLPEDPLDSKEVQIAAGQYAQLTKRIRSLSKNLKRGQVARALIAAAEFPFGEQYPKLKNKDEHELFILLTANDKAKATISKALEMSQKTMLDEAAQNVANEVVEKGGL